MKSLLLIYFVLFSSFLATIHGQEAYWENGIQSFESANYKAAIANFKQYETTIAAQQPSTQFHIAKAYYHLHQLDSAIHYYEKTLQFDNINRINQRCILGLSRAYLQKGDFESAYKTALTYLQDNPDDEAVRTEFQDICLWAYLIKHHRLNPEYLTNYIKKPSYIINSVAAQKLIARNVRNEAGYKFDSDRLEQIGLAQRWYGTFYNETKEQSIHFIFIDPDLIESVREQEKKASEIMTNETLPIYERLGAFYFLTPLNDKKMNLALEQKEETFRFCTCLETPDYVAKRYKKKCIKDKRSIIQAAVNQNTAFAN